MAMTAASASHPFDIVVDPTDDSFQGMDISASAYHFDECRGWFVYPWDIKLS